MSEVAINPREDRVVDIRRHAGASSAERPTGPVDLDRLSKAVREILAAIGEDPDREGLRETPSRVARAYAEIVAGLREDPAEHLGRTFAQGSGDLVTLSGIEFTSLCEHHLLPVIGTAHVAYLPSDGRVVGLSKIARTVDVFARRPQLQERMTAQIADSIMTHLKPRGALVLVEARHLCMTIRGVEKRSSVMRTSASRGVFEQDWAHRDEALQLLGLGTGSSGRTSSGPPHPLRRSIARAPR